MDELADTGSGYFSTRNIIIAIALLVVLYGIYHFMFRSKTSSAVPTEEHRKDMEEFE
jgi:hypothetical protein